MSLKAQLLGERQPKFRIALPDGWVRHEPTLETSEQLLRAARSRLMEAHRPDLYAQISAATKSAFSAMKRAEVIALFMPGPQTPDSLYLPISLTASIRRGPDGASLDSTVAQLIREKGARALGEDKRFVTWRQDSVQELAGGSVPTVSVFYLTPIPESGRKRGLLFTLSTPRPDGDPETVDYAEAAITLFDHCVSTLVWESV
jgi:hypothetical protein